jgi:hypothetical protein
VPHLLRGVLHGTSSTWWYFVLCITCCCSTVCLWWLYCDYIMSKNRMTRHSRWKQPGQDWPSVPVLEENPADIECLGPHLSLVHVLLYSERKYSSIGLERPYYTSSKACLATQGRGSKSYLNTIVACSGLVIHTCQVLRHIERSRSVHNGLWDGFSVAGVTVDLRSCQKKFTNLKMYVTLEESLCLAVVLVQHYFLLHLASVRWEQ